MVAFENMNEVEQGMAVVKCQWLCNPNLPTLAVTTLFLNSLQHDPILVYVYIAKFKS